MEEAIESIATIFAGLGILFVGLSTLKRFTDIIVLNRRFRIWMTRGLSRGIGAYLVSLSLGILTLSSRTTRCVFANLVSLRALTPKKALFALPWSTCGVCIIYFLFALKLETLALILLAVGSFNFAVSRSARYEKWIGLVFALGLVFFGMQLFHRGIDLSGRAFILFDQRIHASLEAIYEANPELQDTLMLLPVQPQDAAMDTPIMELHESLQYTDEIYHHLVYFLQNSSSFLFILGMLATWSFTQLGAIFLSISLASLAYLKVDQGIWLLLGSLLSSGISECIKAGFFTGPSRSLTSYMAILHLLGGGLFAWLFVLEKKGILPFLKDFVSRITLDPTWQIALLVFTMYFLLACIATIFCPVIDYLRRKIFKQEEVQEDNQAKFIHDEALKEPEFAADLIDLEYQDLSKKLLRYVDIFRDHVGTLEKESLDLPKKEKVRKAYSLVSQQLKEFIQDLMHENLSPKAAEELMDKLELLKNLDDLENHMWEFSSATKEFMQGVLADTSLKLVRNLIEVMDAFLLTSIDAIEQADGQNVEILQKISSGSSDQVKNIRESYLQSEQSLDDSGRNQLRWVLFYFENFVLGVQRLSVLLDKNAS